MKVLVATGGTGGHLFPAQQLKALLPDCDLLFAGYKLAETPFFDRKTPYQEIAAAPLQKILPFLLASWKGFWQSIALIRRYQPDVVVGFGSFYSFPVLLASLILRKKIVLFEANCTLGKVNRFFAPFAAKMALQFPMQQKNSVYVHLFPKQTKLPSASAARKALGLHPNLFTILVFGGSQGAVFINQTFCAAASLLKFPFQVIHLTGKEDPEIKYQVPSVVKPFEKEMDLAYASADIAVCRCGAGTTAELIRYQKPAVLIPYPYAYDHQKKNGEFLKEGARLLLQSEANPERLAAEIDALRGEIEMRKEVLKQIEIPETLDFGAVVRAVGAKQ